jgi:hypothetical protein
MSLPRFEEVRHEMTPIPGGFDDYLVHCERGLLSKKGKWLLVDAKGTGDDNKYLATTLIDNEGNKHNYYLSEVVMSSYMGITKAEWRAMGLEVDHIDNSNTKFNGISNLRLASSVANKKNSRDRFWNKVRLSMDVAQQLREEFKQWTGSRVEWYRAKGLELGVSGRSIQNIILLNTYIPKEN